MTMLGYARISTDRQDTALQLDALALHGVPSGAVFTDTMSGANDNRPGLAEALSALRPGGKLVVWRIDRLGRSLRHLLMLSEIIAAKGATLVSLCEGIDLGTPAGRMVFSMLGAVAQFERDVIRERTKAGLAAAKARGVRLGAKPVLTGEKYDIAHRMWIAGIPASRIARDLKCCEATIYKTFPGGRGKRKASISAPCEPC